LFSGLQITPGGAEMQGAASPWSGRHGIELRPGLVRLTRADNGEMEL